MTRSFLDGGPMAGATRIGTDRRRHKADGVPCGTLIPITSRDRDHPQPSTVAGGASSGAMR
jgi:hypothetical protein